MTQTLALRPVEPDEYPAWADADTARYIEDMVSNGGMSRIEATNKALRDRESTLPDGLATPGHGIYYIVEVACGERIGRLWIAERPPVLFLYAIWLAEAVRGQGLGRQAMLLVEQECRRRGLERVELNVFAGNERARHLYRSLGYREVGVYMSLRLDGS